MTLNPEWEEGVRAALLKAAWSTDDTIPLLLPSRNDPPRAYVEAWLKVRSDASEAREAAVARWTKWAAIAAIAAAVLALIGVASGFYFWCHPDQVETRQICKACCTPAQPQDDAISHWQIGRLAPQEHHFRYCQGKLRLLAAAPTISTGISK